MKFSAIPGHEEVKRHLASMVDGRRLPHALLLHGPAGVGKLMMARALATYLHCENPTPDGDSCGRCPSCLQHASHNQVDTHFTFPTLKKRSEDKGFSSDFIEGWKEFLDENPYADMTEWLKKLDKPSGQPVIYITEAEELVRQLSYTTRSAEFKVAVVWLPERLNRDSANHLLKTVEEPFPDTKIIMVSNNPSQILPTIYSRLQRVEMKALPSDIIARRLAEDFPDYPENEIADAADISLGSMHTAVKLLQGVATQKKLQSFMTLMRLAYQRNLGALKKWSDDMASLGREEQIDFLGYCTRLLRENYVANLGIGELNVMTADEKKFSTNFSRFITSRNILPLMEEMDKAAHDIAANGNGKIIFFDLCIRVILLLK